IIYESAFLPCFPLLIPFSPLLALKCRLYLKSISVLKPSSTLNTISPPFPPSPPAGPPLGTYFSRRKAAIPFPPSPALTYILTLSTNIVSPHSFLYILLDYEPTEKIILIMINRQPLYIHKSISSYIIKHKIIN